MAGGAAILTAAAASATPAATATPNKQQSPHVFIEASLPSSNKHNNIYDCWLLHYLAATPRTASPDTVAPAVALEATFTAVAPEVAQEQQIQI